ISKRRRRSSSVPSSSPAPSPSIPSLTSTSKPKINLKRRRRSSSVPVSSKEKWPRELSPTTEPTCDEEPEGKKAVEVIDLCSDSDGNEGSVHVSVHVKLEREDTPILSSRQGHKRGRGWPQAYHAVELKPLFEASLDKKVKRSDVKSLFAKAFPDIKYSSTTFYDHRDRWLRAPESLRSKLVAAGVTSEGRWTLLMQEVPAKNAEIKAARKKSRRAVQRQQSIVNDEEESVWGEEGEDEDDEDDDGWTKKEWVVKRRSWHAERRILLAHKKKEFDAGVDLLGNDDSDEYVEENDADWIGPSRVKVEEEEDELFDDCDP
ncbi:hypothetical protein K435DRAFT_881649, partial [Dendrothele bispora CBS 962.96]